MFERGVEEEVTRALAGRSRRPRGVIGLEEVAGLPPGEAAAAISLRTRRYAAYQRKWLRRLPAVRVDASRTVEDVAGEILPLAAFETVRDRP